MGGGGGVSGAVIFPEYIMDIHGVALAGFPVSEEGRWLATPDYGVGKPLYDVLNTALNTNPWSLLTLSNPTSELDNIPAQQDLFYAQVTALNRDNMANYIADALNAVTQVSSNDIPEVAVSLGASTKTDVQTLWDAHVDTLIGKLPAVVAAANTNAASQANLESLITSAASLAQSEASFSAATTAYRVLIAAATNALRDCNLPREVNLSAVLQKAATDADRNLRAALKVVKKYMDGDLLAEVTSQYEARRETTYQQQLSSFSGQMSDLNAVNSSAFLFGQAILKSEQMREVAEFDANLSLSQFQQGLALWIQEHTAALSAGIQSEDANSRNHTAIINASLELMASLQDRGELKPSDLLGAYANMFNGEVGNNAAIVDALMRHMGFMRRDNLNDTYQRDSLSANLELQVEEINKRAKEARFLAGIDQVNSLLVNRAQFEQVRAGMEMKYRTDRAQIVALHEEKENEIAFQEDIWDFNAFRRFGEVLAAPAGMAGQVQEKPSLGREILGTGLQIAAGLALGGGGGAVAAGAVGKSAAIGGASTVGAGNLLSSLYNY